MSSGKDIKNRINKQITAPTVRLVDDKGTQLGVMSLAEALSMADQEQKDLVEIHPNAEPPVVRLVDYGKFVFQQNKQKSAAKKSQRRVKVKEVKFRPGTDVGDYEVKLRNLRGFLEGGDKVKITVWFKGREMAHQEYGIKLLERVRADLDDVGKVEYFPKLEGRQLLMVMAPKKSNGKTK